MTNTGLIAMSNELIRRGLAHVIDESTELQLIAQASSIEETSRILTEGPPAVIVLGDQLPDGPGIPACQAIRNEFPQLGIVLLSFGPPGNQLLAAMAAGVSALVTTDDSAEQLVEAMTHAARFPTDFMAAGLAEAIRDRTEPAGPHLSPRESEVLQLLADGLAITQISNDLYISESTTKTHIARLYDKLGVNNRAQALMTAVRYGLVTIGNDPLEREFTSE